MEALAEAMAEHVCRLSVPAWPDLQALDLKPWQVESG